MPPAFFFFFRIALAILGLLWFHINFRIICSSSVKNNQGNFIGTALNLQIAFGSMVILTILILPSQKHGISFQTESSSIPLINIFIVLGICLSPSWSGLTQYFISEDAILKRAVFLQSFFCYFIISVKKCNRFPYINLVSCYLAEFTYQFE